MNWLKRLLGKREVPMDRRTNAVPQHDLDRRRQMDEEIARGLVFNRHERAVIKSETPKTVGYYNTMGRWAEMMRESG